MLLSIYCVSKETKSKTLKNVTGDKIKRKIQAIRIKEWRKKLYKGRFI